MTTAQRAAIWLVEDDAACRDIVVSILADRWTLRTYDSLGALERAASAGDSPMHLVIADMCFPDQQLVSWLRTDVARHLLADVPLLVISALDDVDVIRSAFDGGAVDFLSKPFGKGELVVKVERALGAGSHVPASMPYALDVASMVVRRSDGVTAALTAKEMQIAALLWNAAGQSLSRETLYATLWRDCRVGPKTLDVHVSRLRRKLRSIGLDVRTNTSRVSLATESLSRAAGRRRGS